MRYHSGNKDEAVSLVEEESLHMGYIECLCKETGYISVWNNNYIAGCKPSQKQLNALKTLKLNGLYHGRIDDIFTPQQRMLQFLNG